VSTSSAQPAEGTASPGSEGTAAGGDAIARYCAASSANDLDALIATLAPDAELVSPLSGRMVFRGQRDLRVLLGTIYSLLRDLRWGEPMGDGATRTVIARGRLAGLRLDDAMVFELDSEGLIRRVRPHLRPWLSLTVLALALGPRLARHPGVLLRALRAS
jgi:hypothetical protein